MDGQAYVTVQANEADGMNLYAAGSTGGGAITKGAIITWSFDGGISGRYGWVDKEGNQIVPDENSVDNTNAIVSKAFEGADLLQLIDIGKCVTFTS